jgi:uncharacterized protein
LIFVDTSFWVAARLRDDARHAEAVALLERWERDRLLTSNHVRGETWTFVRRRRGHASAAAFLDTLERTARVEVRHVEPELEEESLQWLRQHDEREYSYVDATSFALMRKLGVREALSFDGDFAAAGFVELRP